MTNKKDIALINAAKKRDLLTIKKLIHQGANINAILYGKTALIYAAKNGDEEIVNYLIANGADVNYVVKNNYHDQILKIDSLQKLCILRESIGYNIWNWYNYFNTFDFPIKKGDNALIVAAKYDYPKIVEKLAYIIYEREKQKWHQLKLPNFVITINNKFKTLQELANDVQKTITGVDFKDQSPYQKLVMHLNLVNLKIDNQILTKIDKRIGEENWSLIKEINETKLQNQISLTKYTNYCTIL